MTLPCAVHACTVPGCCVCSRAFAILNTIDAIESAPLSLDIGMTVAYQRDT